MERASRPPATLVGRLMMTRRRPLTHNAINETFSRLLAAVSEQVPPRMIPRVLRANFIILSHASRATARRFELIMRATFALISRWAGDDCALQCFHLGVRAGLLEQAR